MGELFLVIARGENEGANLSFGKKDPNLNFIFSMHYIINLMAGS